jgi:hypothetical protein
LLALGLLVGSTPAVMAVRLGARFQSHSVSERVAKLFAKMLEGKYGGMGLPDLAWHDIPALLELGGSKRVLKNFPVNFLSSQSQSECTEGMIALWLVEGIRTGGKELPSLNPLVTPLKSGENYQKQSENRHDQVLEAYQKWWNQVKAIPVEEAKKIDPLAKAGLAWYGPSQR